MRHVKTHMTSPEYDPDFDRDEPWCGRWWDLCGVQTCMGTESTMLRQGLQKPANSREHGAVLHRPASGRSAKNKENKNKNPANGGGHYAQTSVETVYV